MNRERDRQRGRETDWEAERENWNDKFFHALLMEWKLANVSSDLYPGKKKNTHTQMGSIDSFRALGDRKTAMDERETLEWMDGEGMRQRKRRRRQSGMKPEIRLEIETDLLLMNSSFAFRSFSQCRMCVFLYLHNQLVAKATIFFFFCGSKNYENFFFLTG